MSNTSVFFFSYFIAVFLLGFTALAADLDVERAKRRYEEAKRESDLAGEKLQVQKANLDRVSRDYSQAQANEREARSRLSDEERELERMDRELTSVETAIGELKSDIEELKRQVPGLERKISSLQTKVDRLEDKSHHLEHQVEEVERKIREVEAGSDPNKEAELARLRTERDRLKHDLDHANSELRNAKRELQSAEGELSQLRSRLSQSERELSRKESEKSGLVRARELQVRIVTDARTDLRLKEQETRFAYQRLSDAQVSHDLARAEYDEKARLAQDAYRYYQVVLANYEKALADVYAKADAAALADGGREGSKRGIAPGASHGERDAQIVGHAAGLAASKSRSQAQGYKEGREKALSDSSLATPYGTGRQQGRDIALQKAIEESFPRGHNSRLGLLLAGTPAGQTTVDISTSIPEEAGEEVGPVETKPLSVGSVGAPTFVFPIEEPYSVPQPSNPSVGVPAKQNLYYAPPCSGLVLAEFEPRCRSRYEDSYQKAYAEKYREVYTIHFRQRFAANIEGHYKASFNLSHPAVFESARNQGATEQGVLDGFAEYLPVAEAEQFALGEENVRGLFEKGFHLVFRNASLNDEDGDGTFTPGETAQLSLLLDNLGKRATKLKQVRVRIDQTTGFGPLNHKVRELPALSGDTSTTLLGVAGATVKTTIAGDSLSLAGVIEAEINGKFVAVANFSAIGSVRFPAQITEMKLPKDAKIDEAIKVTLTMQNQTRAPFKGGTMALKSSPAFVTVVDKEVTLPSLDVGQSAEVTVTIKPGVWVGENTHVNFVSEIKPTEGRAFSQSFPKFIHIDRAGALLLYNSSGKPEPDSSVEVAAGGRLTFYAHFVYQSSQSRPGPFKLSLVAPSNPAISLVSGSTVSIDYGSFWPGRKVEPLRVTYQIPASLKGKNEWVMATMTEGGRLIHSLPLYLEIQ